VDKFIKLMVRYSSMSCMKPKTKYKKKEIKTPILVHSKSSLSINSVKAVQKTMKERICERDELQVWSERSRE